MKNWLSPPPGLHPLFRLVAIFGVSLLILVGYSVTDLEFQVAGVPLKKLDLPNAESLPQQTPLASKVPVQKAAYHQTRMLNTNWRPAPLKPQPQAYYLRPPVLDTSAHRILMTGDSMTEGLLFPFDEYCEANGHTFKGIPIYSATTLSLAQSDTLETLIRQFEPTFVILTLGSNELFIRDIENRRRKYVLEILSQFEGIQYVWVGPPNWKPDTGINDLIVSEVGQNRFFLSRDLEFERRSDGAHPTWAASRIWADTLARWIMQTSQHRIKLEKPPQS